MTNHYSEFDEPLGMSAHAMSQWLVTSKLTTKRVLRLFKQDFMVLYPRDPRTSVPRPIKDSLLTDGINNCFLPESSIERYFDGLYVIQPNNGSTFVNSVFCTAEKP